MTPDQKRIVELTEHLKSTLLALATVLAEPGYNEAQVRKTLSEGMAALRSRRLFTVRELQQDHG